MAHRLAEIEAAIRRVAVLKSASEDDVQRIAQMGVERFVEEGGFFFFQGDPAEFAYILISGRAKLCQISPDGQQVNLRVVVPCNLFGAIGAVQEGAVYPACAQALEDSAALAIPSDGFRHLLEERPHLSLGLMKLMTGYIQELQERYRENVTERVEQRVARVLLRLVAQGGQRTAQGIELAFSRQDLAEIAGTTLYTVSRILSGWERKGLLIAGRERVIIVQPHELLRVAEGLA